MLKSGLLITNQIPEFCYSYSFPGPFWSNRSRLSSKPLFPNSPDYPHSPIHPFPHLPNSQFSHFPLSDTSTSPTLHPVRHFPHLPHFLIPPNFPFPTHFPIPTLPPLPYFPPPPSPPPLLPDFPHSYRPLPFVSQQAGCTRCYQQCRAEPVWCISCTLQAQSNSRLSLWLVSFWNYWYFRLYQYFRYLLVTVHSDCWLEHRQTWLRNFLRLFYNKNDVTIFSVSELLPLFPRNVLGKTKRTYHLMATVD